MEVDQERVNCTERKLAFYDWCFQSAHFQHFTPNKFSEVVRYNTLERSALVRQRTLLKAAQL